MFDKSNDNLLVESGIKFLPWVGKNYQKGFHGHRFLVLGESHYAEWGGQRHVLNNDFTRECIRKTIIRERGAPFWRNIEQTLLNEELENYWAPSGGKSLWERLAFYNFLQSPVQGEWNTVPTQQAFQESQRPFRAVLEQLRPEKIWVCGKRLWHNMEKRERCVSEDIQAYRLTDGTMVWCFATRHPSAYFNWRRHHPLLLDFINSLLPQDPTRACS